MYVPLRAHGDHSLLTGVDPAATLLERAAALGLPALALVDVDTLAGLVEFLQAAERVSGGPRPIIGAEISDPSGAPGRLIALVRDEAGYRSLCKLVSSRQLGDDPGDPEADLDPATGASPRSAEETFDLVEAATRFQEGLTFLVDHPRLVFALGGRIPARRLLVAVSPAGLGKRPPAGVQRVRAGESRNAHRARPRPSLALTPIPSPAPTPIPSPAPTRPGMTSTGP
ncbi:MAG: PHP domain-containing protein, partial [Planctomycetota bacterium]|nr:PHP domain-containing protein [Planctomycetota bacterium]